MVPVPDTVVQWINREFPKPRIDMVSAGALQLALQLTFAPRHQEWLEGCYEWVVTTSQGRPLDPVADFDIITNAVRDQLRGSHLEASTVSGTGLPAIAQQFSGTLPFKDQPLLVEIIAMTEVGHSAFTLTNTRQTRIDREDLAGMALERGDDEAAEDEGPIPKYPRSMLRLEITDGTITMRAMEYRRLPELELGVTPLGYKVHLLFEFDLLTRINSFHRCNSRTQ
jgi:RecQ-mediated genome instability protein 1